jgi:hypothetical protein
VSSPVIRTLVGEEYRYDVDASGSPAPAYSLEGAPAGMAIDPASGLITWTPSSTGLVPVTVRAEYGAAADTQTFQLSVGEALGLQCTPARGPSAIDAPAAGDMVLTYRPFQVTLQAASPGTLPYANGPSVLATFTGLSGAAAGQQVVVEGFWDGGSTWVLRFAPTAAGEWSYTTESTDPGLDGQTGLLTAINPTPSELAAFPLLGGFLERDGQAWKLSDGTPFLAVGDTLWSFAEETTLDEWERWMSARQAQGFNTFLGAVWMALYDRPEATEHPFPDKDPKTDELNVAYFQRLDRMVEYANQRGISVGLSIGGFPGNSSWFDRFGSRERNDRWFRYVVARYAAYNVRWMLYGEANEANTPWGTTWEQEVAHNAQIVKDLDPYDHPLGNHHTEVDRVSASSENIDYIEAQVDRTETQYQVALDLRSYGKPVWFEEYWYEPQVYDDDVELGIRNTHRSFVAALAFPTMGSLMRAHYPDFDLNQVETDPGAVRMCYFSKFYTGLDYRSFTPASNLVDRGQAGRFGSDYAIFLQGGGVVTIGLRGTGAEYAVKWLDINTGLLFPAQEVSGGGLRAIDTGTDQDVAVLLIEK